MLAASLAPVLQIPASLLSLGRPDAALTPLMPENNYLGVIKSLRTGAMGGDFDGCLSWHLILISTME